MLPFGLWALTSRGKPEPRAKQCKPDKSCLCGRRWGPKGKLQGRSGMEKTMEPLVQLSAVPLVPWVWMMDSCWVPAAPWLCAWTTHLSGHADVTNPSLLSHWNQNITDTAWAETVAWTEIICWAHPSSGGRAHPILLTVSNARTSLRTVLALLKGYCNLLKRELGAWGQKYYSFFTGGRKKTGKR